MKVQLLGAAQTVTGSCYMIEACGKRFCIDCGMHQGNKAIEARNRETEVYRPTDIDFVLITHAHIDHSGLLPKLVREGFENPVYCTKATSELLDLMLQDSAHIQEMEALWEAKKYMRRGLKNPPAALYTVADAQKAVTLFSAVDYHKTFEPAPGISVTYYDAGHILGSSWLEVTVSGEGRPRRLVFSGDLGMRDRPVLRDPEPPVPEADLLLIESTYGDRLHRPLPETEEEIIAAIGRTRACHGNLVIPSFAVGRTQEIIYILADLVRRQRLAPLKVYVDSPMANAATRITLAHPALLDSETRELLDWVEGHPDKLKIEFVADAERSKALNEVKSGAVIISASGMCEAGRIKYHLRENLPRSECSVLIAGFQAAGTLGRRLVDGARLVHIFGAPVPVRARIYTVGGLSAHADQAELLHWLRGFHTPPRHTFVMHGEAGASASFAKAIHDQLGWPEAHLPRIGEYVTL